jgi:hypothetical protein
MTTGWLAVANIFPGLDILRKHYSINSIFLRNCAEKLEMT